MVLARYCSNKSGTCFREAIFLNGWNSVCSVLAFPPSAFFDDVSFDIVFAGEHARQGSVGPLPPLFQCSRTCSFIPSGNKRFLFRKTKHIFVRGCFLHFVTPEAQTWPLVRTLARIFLSLSLCSKAIIEGQREGCERWETERIRARSNGLFLIVRGSYGSTAGRGTWLSWGTKGKDKILHFPHCLVFVASSTWSFYCLVLQNK